MYPPDLPLFIYTPDPNSNSSSRFDEELNHLASSSLCFPYSPYTLQYSEDHFFDELTWEQLQDRQLLTDHHQTVMHNPCDAPKQDAAPPKQGFLMPRDELSNATRKRPMKKDRHSKITTAKGPRDRRIRLSQVVARKLFDLQDALEYDKASKIVEWLFIQAKSAVDEVLQGYTTAVATTTAASVSSTHSECEVVSGFNDAGATAAVKGSKKKAKVVSAKWTRESRMEARERARKRTLTRKGVDLKQCMEGGFWGQSIGQKDEQRDYGGGDDISVITRNWNSCCIYQQDDDAAQTSHVTGFEYCGKAWEAYNNM